MGKRVQNYLLNRIIHNRDNTFVLIVYVNTSITFSLSVNQVKLLSMQELPEALKPISWIEGRWSTNEGKGVYPNIPDFSYHEQLEFICIGQPMYNFSSISRHPEKQTPMHQERGFLRVKPESNQIAFILSHNFGLTSIEEGTYDAEKKEIVLETVNLTRMSFAKPPHVTKVKRVMRLIKPDSLEVTLYMETDNTPLTQHLQAVYEKISE